MHEINIAKQIMDKLKGKKIKSVTIEVGELCNFFPEEIKETLEKMSDWKVKVVEKPGLVKCSCGYEGRSEILEKEHGFVVFTCPKCKGKPKIVKGNEVKILNVE
jgi:Zn finger protein HypA/HybF involved in hydrogenase expression